MTNATWRKNPGSNNFDAAGNWSPATAPNGKAFFGSSNTKDLTFSVTTTIGGWTFSSNASHYSFDIPTTPDLAFDGLEFVGAGIVGKSGRASITNGDNLKFFNASTAGSAHIANHSSGNVSFFNSSTAGSAKFTNDGFVQFFNASAAGRAHITNNNTLEFYNDSRAGKSVIINVNNHVLNFNDSSTAGASTIINSAGSDLHFKNGSSGGTARITNSGDIDFNNSSTAGGATINNIDFGDINFFGGSEGGHARIAGYSVEFFDSATAALAHIAAHQLTFFEASTAGSAVITTINGARTEFHDNSDPTSARFITKAGGVVDFSLGSGPVGDHVLTLGSIEGAGNYNLGANHLHVGFNNRSTNVSGAIDGVGGSGGGSLVKFGTGVLKLSHAGNTFPGGTTIHEGTLDVAALGAAGSGQINFDAGRQTLKIENAALANHTFGNVITAFDTGDAIDLAGLKFVKHAKVTYDGGSKVLTVHSGKVTDTLTLIPAILQFKAVDDGHGGTKIIAKPAGAKENALAAPQHASSSDRATDSFQFKHQVELGRHGATDFDLHLGLATETLAFNESVGAMDQQSYLANFHIDMHHTANIASYDFTM
jgi:autotransporter-associated beta strand protein